MGNVSSLDELSRLNGVRLTVVGIHINTDESDRRRPLFGTTAREVMKSITTIQMKLQSCTGELLGIVAGFTSLAFEDVILAISVIGATAIHGCPVESIYERE